jgi:CP family cyanate transporter-like MFS transporter
MYATSGEMVQWYQALMNGQVLNSKSFNGLTTFVGVPSGFLASLLFRRFKSLSGVAMVMTSLTLIGLLMIWLTPELLVLACVITGFGFAATFPLSLTLIGSRASTSTQTTQLSALAQGWGYLISAAGTFGFGLLRDVTGTWDASLVLVAVLTFIQLFAGAVAGRDKRIPAA